MRGAKGLFKSWVPMEKISSADFHRVNPELARGFGFCGFLEKGELSWLQKKSRGSCLRPELPLEIEAAASQMQGGVGRGCLFVGGCGRRLFGNGWEPRSYGTETAPLVIFVVSLQAKGRGTRVGWHML